MAATVGGVPPVNDGNLPGDAPRPNTFGPMLVSGTKAQRRVLCLAVGVLVGLKRRRWQDAAVELIAVAHDSGMSPYVLAEALVELSGGHSLRLAGQSRPDAVRTAQRYWGHLLNQVPGSTEDQDPKHVLVWCDLGPAQ
ncbi:hypothetical protein BOO86_28695 [Mycobacterium sp. CBMA 234]|uniref:hypothetical protein n=1 Tax=Mycolicibacterium sp. CBMA 234 TaxID=1918495 RepID=UPI001390EED8|nr:hypothetical protein [Mycolicibacterium sp. CBMA 234]MUL68479.1 hypothetical protein [Mycolicibacterium sp. CBMA 234]